MDGSSIRVPDTVENREEFGGHRSHGTVSGHPMVRVVVLILLSQFWHDQITIGASSHMPREKTGGTGACCASASRESGGRIEVPARRFARRRPAAFRTHIQLIK